VLPGCGRSSASPTSWRKTLRRTGCPAGTRPSPAGIAAQRDLIRARLDCSALLRGRIEQIAGMLGLPTRAEVDGLHQNLHGLKRELRTLRARLDARPDGSRGSPGKSDK
jgi:hypothetical protein